MSYADPDRRQYSFGLVDFGAGANVSLSLQGPKGKAGRLVSIHLTATEVFTADGAIQIGTASDPDAYANFVVGTVAATDSVCSDDGVTDPDAIIDANIPADTQVEVTCVKTTGTPTGQGLVSVIIDWAW